MAKTTPVATKVLTWTATFNTETNGTVYEIGHLPKGVTVLSAAVYHGALGASTTLKLGDVTDDDRYIAAASSATAGKLAMTDTLAGGVGYKVADSNVILTLGGADTAASDQAVLVIIEYAETYE